MATSKQEQLYNELVEYYSYADQLISIIEEEDAPNHPEHLEAIENIVSTLEKFADELTTQFIDFVKSGYSKLVEDNIKNSLNQIMVGVDECRKQIYMLYNIDSPINQQESLQ